jgi:predicted GNAT family acetyltransferase
MADERVDVVDNPDKHRYEARDAGGSVWGFAAYRRTSDAIVFTHTEVDDAQEGKGIASRLIRGALDDARQAGLPVVPLCPFVKAYIERHHEYADLVAG